MKKLPIAFAVARILAVAVLMAFAGSAAAQQAYPNKPIRFIVPFPPGNGTDIVARLIGPKLTESWGQQVIVDNRPGGNTVIASEALVKSSSDGYTLMMTGSIHATNSSLIPHLPYDSVKDFAPVASVISNENVLVLNPSVPANNLQEFIALAKSRPGQFNYATTSAGGPQHLGAESFCIMTGVRMQHIPYKGTGQILADLIGGQIQLTFTSPINVIQQIKSGQIKAIAISGESRLSSLPQVPTFTEAGLPGFEARYWSGFFAPAGTPREIINKLSAELAKIMAVPEFKEKLAGLGAEPFVSGPDQFGALVRAEIARYAKIIKTANIKLGN